MSEFQFFCFNETVTLEYDPVPDPSDDGKLVKSTYEYEFVKGTVENVDKVKAVVDVNTATSTNGETCTFALDDQQCSACSTCPGTSIVDFTVDCGNLFGGTSQGCLNPVAAAEPYLHIASSASTATSNVALATTTGIIVSVGAMVLATVVL